MGLDYSMQLIMSGVLNVTQVCLGLFPPPTVNLCFSYFFEANYAIHQTKFLHGILKPSSLKSHLLYNFGECNL